MDTNYNEDLYKNKYLKYKYKYLELKGSSSLLKKITGISAKSQNKIDEEKIEQELYGPKLLENIKSHISVAEGNISTKPLFSIISGQRIYDIDTINYFEWPSFLELLDKIAQVENIAKVENLTKLFTDIKKLIIDNRIKPIDQRMSGYDQLKIDIDLLFDLKENKNLSSFPILKKLFKLYYQTIEKVKIAINKKK